MPAPQQALQGHASRARCQQHGQGRASHKHTLTLAQNDLWVSLGQRLLKLMIRSSKIQHPTPSSQIHLILKIFLKINLQEAVKANTGPSAVSDFSVVLQLCAFFFLLTGIFHIPCFLRGLFMGRYSQKAEVPAVRTNAERLGRANPPRGSFRHHCHHMVSLVRAPRSWCCSHLVLQPRSSSGYCRATLQQGGGSCPRAEQHRGEWQLSC